MKHPLRDWRKLGECQKVITHSPVGGGYRAVAVNSEGLLAVTEEESKCVHLLTKEGALVRSIGKGVLSEVLFGVTFDPKGNVWVADWDNNEVIKLSQDGRLLQTIRHAGSESDGLSCPRSVFVSPEEGLIYICDTSNHRVTVHNEEGKFLFAFGSKGRDPGCFGRPLHIGYCSDGLLRVTDIENGTVSVWSKEGTFKDYFKPKYVPTCIAATSDNHLLITSYTSEIVVVYTLEGELVHEFGGNGSHPGSFSGPLGICVDDNGVVYVADCYNNRVQVF